MRSVNLLFMSLFVLMVIASCSESVNTKKLSEDNASILNEKLSMPTALEIIKKSHNQNTSKSYFNSISDLYKSVGSQQQGEMLVEGYSVSDINSPIIGYSLFFIKITGEIAILDASVNPLNSKALEAVSHIINKSLDSVNAGGGAKLYFLGLYDIGEKQKLKIMVREGTTSQGKEYAIRYAVSSK